MSGEELAACLDGLLIEQRREMVVPPDNRCCFCLTLRLGAIIIGLVNFVLYLLAFTWYIGYFGFSGDFENQMDISVLVLFCVQLMVNLLLVVGAVKRLPLHIFPWLCSNAVVIAIIMVMIFMLVFFGASRNDMNYSEYVTSLSLLSLLAGTDMFCCIVVFQFRRNLILEDRMQSEPTGGRGGERQGCTPPSTAPPAYEDAAPGSPSLKPPVFEEPPPEYEAAIAMLHSDNSGGRDLSYPPSSVDAAGCGGGGGGNLAADQDSGPHQRRKSSLTNNHV